MGIEENQRAIRQFLGMRLTDLERATGIAAARLSESERGLSRLRPAEQRVVTNFLREKLTAELAAEQNHASPVTPSAISLFSGDAR